MSFLIVPRTASVSASNTSDRYSDELLRRPRQRCTFRSPADRPVIVASCSTNPAATPAAEAAPPPLTQSKAAEQCWMETEHGAKSLPPEKRAKVVDQCVKDKMSGAK